MEIQILTTFPNGQEACKKASFFVYLIENKQDMGCNCKNKAGVAGKYSDDGKSGLQKAKGFEKLLVVLGRILIGVLVSGIIIVALPLVVLVVIFNTFFGRSTTINLMKLIRRG